MKQNIWPLMGSGERYELRKDIGKFDGVGRLRLASLGHRAATRYGHQAAGSTAGQANSLVESIEASPAGGMRGGGLTRVKPPKAAKC